MADKKTKIIKDLSFEEYRELPAMSQSSLKMVLQSPAHFKYFTENPRAETPALVFGGVAHTVILEPEKLYNDFFVMPKIDGRTKAGKAEKRHSKARGTR